MTTVLSLLADCCAVGHLPDVGQHAGWRYRTNESSHVNVRDELRGRNSWRVASVRAKDGPRMDVGMLGKRLPSQLCETDALETRVNGKHW
jgi:hypothetical protein